ncbi:MAG: response regulator transcription factor [Cohaesibacter sp.]|jgi:DNA-binding NarL/FixJ family response regulator|nr:response regulator transcription factor [Cohaesibacter sp.]
MLLLEDVGGEVRRGLDHQAEQGVVTYRTLVLAEPHPIFTECLLNMLGIKREYTPVLECSGLDQLLSAAPDREDTLLILNLSATASRGSAAIVDVRKAYKHARLILICDDNDEGLAHFALGHGADWVLKKTSAVSELRSIVSRVKAGLSDDVPVVEGEEVVERSGLYSKLANLTPKQMTILQYLRDGLLNKQIAYELGLTEATVKHHISLILKKLNCYRRTQAVAIANRMM